MFGKLPELFGREFAIGYFVPVASFILASLYLAICYGVEIPEAFQINSDSQVENFFGSITIAFLSWLIAILLLALNREIIRFFEGYGDLNPLYIFKFIQRKKFIRDREKIIFLCNEASHRMLTESEERERGILMLNMSEYFPDQEQFLLPTPFGNRIRAFEVYPRVMYGIESISGWERLQYVILEDSRKLIDNVKSFVDFWLNSFLLCLGLLVEYIYHFINNSCNILVWWFPLIVIFACIMSYLRLLSAVISWGSAIKAAFDVYLPVLQERLQYGEFQSFEEQKRVWEKISQAYLYRNPDYWPAWDKKKLPKEDN